jgi:hypothetical protein
MTNMNKGLFVSTAVILLLTFTPINAQTLKQRETWTKKIESLLPDNYEVRGLEFGHLDNDTLTDAILILKSRFETFEDSTQRDQYRPLLIVVQQTDKSFKVIKRNDHVVLCKKCGGTFSDPYEGVIIDNKTFQIIFSGGSRWRWTREISFGYDSSISNWVLLNDSGYSIDGLQMDTVDYPKNIIYTSIDNGKTKITVDQYKGDN